MPEVASVDMVTGVILAGDRGERLGTVTENWPAPMLTIAGRPVMEWTAIQLVHADIVNIWFTMCWKSKSIPKHFGDGKQVNGSFQFLKERKLSGTAGPLRKLSTYLGTDTVVLCCGDVITNLNIGELLSYHRSHHSEFTVALHQEEVYTLPSKGIAETDRDGKLLGFLEKPNTMMLFSNWAASGIYVLETSAIDFVPKQEIAGIGEHLIPALIAADRRVYGYKAEYYSMDVGTPEAFKQAELDIMQGGIF